MPPLSSDVQQTRQYFRKSMHLFDELRRKFSNIPWKHISMGTSADYEIAVEEGATIVRIGQAILGARK